MELFVEQTLRMFIKLLPIFLFIILFGVIYKKVVGKAGEFHVKNLLKKLPKNEYLVINDLMVKVNSITHQIDHVVISSYGIFVIETKQYNGYITGNEYDKKWVQNKEYYINNPIHQNYGHVLALKEVLGLDISKFIPIVCIPSRATVRVKSKSHVLRYNNLNSTILSYQEKIIDNYKEIYDKLLKLNIVDKEERKKHVEYARKVKKEKEIKDINRCPICGGELVKRNGKYGEFIGCSNYPKCKYIKK